MRFESTVCAVGVIWPKIARKRREHLIVNMREFAADRGFEVMAVVHYDPDLGIFQFLDTLGEYRGVIVPSLKHLDGLERAVTWNSVLLTVWQRQLYPIGWDWPEPVLPAEQKEGPWRP